MHDELRAALEANESWEPPLRLNLGCGTPGTRSWHPITGLVNLDKSFGWKFEDGLGDFVDRSVAGITVSHALMYVALAEWPRVFAEFARVLRDGGVLRITEDDTQDTRSSRLGGWRGSEPAVTLTDAEMVKAHMRAAGFAAFDVDAAEARDRSLIQAQHGAPPDVFFVEGVRAARVLFSPHADDEALFASFSILRYRPRVVVCFPSGGDYGSTEERFAETCEAMRVLGGREPDQWLSTVDTLAARMRAYDTEFLPSLVLAPHPRASHPEHVAVALAARAVFGDRVRAFHTYDEAGKVDADYEVPFEPEWIEQKHRALLRYQSQMTHPRAGRFFLASMLEYSDAP